MRRDYSLTLPALLVAALSGCGEITAVYEYQATAPFFEQFSSAGITALDLSSITGRVEITGTAPGSPIIVEATRRVRAESQAEADEGLESLNVDASVENDRLVVRTIQPSGTARVTYVVDYEIRVPSNLSLVVEHVTGDVRVEHARGGLALTSVTGSVELEDLFGPVDVELVTGTVSGDVTLPEGAQLAVEVVTGTISLQLPRSTAGLLTASVVTGSISVSGFQGGDEDPRTTAVRVRLGSGNSSLDLSVVTGTISVAAIS